MAAGDAWMPHDCHDELALASLERPLNPGPLPLIERAQDSGVDRQQRKSVGLQLKKAPRWLPARTL